MAPEEAGLAARRQFGNAGLHQQNLRDQSRFLLLNHLWRDLRYAVRGMLRNPGFALTAILTLALGMGANVAVFALMDAILLRSLPVGSPQRLYFVDFAGAAGLGIAPPYPFLQRMQREAHSLESVAAYSGRAQLKIRPESSANFETANGARVSGNYYEVLGLRAALGRLLTAQDELLNPAVAVLSYDYWQTRYAGSAAALGSSFTLDGTSFTIVGVAPKGFSGLQPGHRDDITIPITTMNLGPHDGAGMLADHNSPWFQAVGRLAPGVSPAKARAEIDTLFQSYMTEFPVSAEARRDQFNHIELVSAAKGLGALRKQFERPLEALMAVVALVLLIACANITNLLLARATRPRTRVRRPHRAGSRTPPTAASAPYRDRSTLLCWSGCGPCRRLRCCAPSAAILLDWAAAHSTQLSFRWAVACLRPGAAAASYASLRRCSHPAYAAHRPSLRDERGLKNERVRASHEPRARPDCAAGCALADSARRGITFPENTAQSTQHRSWLLRRPGRPDANQSTGIWIS
ncbi:ABC transporter permease [Occallatibacter riparius]|uniref:ABC transporter permease n=1 Tax=Occallatibacter riparius TaxID=1002689 RepID=A0A9J7BNG1_9BACT|nr:ABC transporter permease [Occallatibacter riparius]UWZ84428.1 ABC transporter permease [Occallatibacter riparius]